MGRITIDQSHQVMATLAINTDWDQIDFEGAKLQELIVRNPKEAGKQFATFLKNGGRVIVSAKEFQVWKTVTLGTYKSVSGLRTALGNAGFKIGTYASQLLDKVTVAPKENALELVNVSVGELGFPKGATRADVYKRASELGLDLVPA